MVVQMLQEYTNTVAILMSADINWNEDAALMSPMKAKNSIAPEVIARIETNKEAVETDVDRNAMAALLSPEKPKNSLTPRSLRIPLPRQLLPTLRTARGPLKVARRRLSLVILSFSHS
jgi:hypothetical protein